MQLKETLNQLENLGTQQNRKVYMRHGSGPHVFGVSFANLNKLAKKIRMDHTLALSLWQSENVDAQTLATMIADPAKLDFKTVDAWLKKLEYPFVLGLLAGLVAKTRFAKVALKKWTSSKKEFVKTAGFNLLAHMLKDGVEIPLDELEEFIVTIETQIHQSPNKARYAMNGALIAIGIYSQTLNKKALAAAKSIGKVEVDHGDTSCKTPDAFAYIQKAARQTIPKSKKK